MDVPTPFVRKRRGFDTLMQAEDSGEGDDGSTAGDEGADIELTRASYSNSTEPHTRPADESSRAQPGPGAAGPMGSAIAVDDPEAGDASDMAHGERPPR